MGISTRCRIRKIVGEFSTSLQEEQNMPDEIERSVAGFISEAMSVCRKYTGELSGRKTDRQRELSLLVDKWALEDISGED
jgi:hypothetical protein